MRGVRVADEGTVETVAVTGGCVGSTGKVDPCHRGLVLVAAISGKGVIWFCTTTIELPNQMANANSVPSMTTIEKLKIDLKQDRGVLLIRLDF